MKLFNSNSSLSESCKVISGPLQSEFHTYSLATEFRETECLDKFKTFIRTLFLFAWILKFLEILGIHELLIHMYLRDNMDITQVELGLQYIFG